MLSTQEIDTYFQTLNEELETRPITKPVRLVVVGGAFMISFIKNRSATKDVDIIPLSFPDSMNEDKATKAFRSAANAVAKTHGIRRDWINDVVASFAPEPGPVTLWHDYPNLQVYVPSPEYILVLKLLAGRDRDEDDILALCKLLTIQTREQAQVLVDRYTTSQWQQECNLSATLDALF
jgi:Nucleotidyltransferase of unknown function (DUF6036)